MFLVGKFCEHSYVGRRVDIVIRQSTLYLMLVSVSEKPSIGLSRVRDIRVDAGWDIKIVVSVKGWSVPTAIWELNGQPIKTGGQVKIEVRLFTFDGPLTHCMICPQSRSLVAIPLIFPPYGKCFVPA